MNQEALAALSTQQLYDEMAARRARAKEIRAENLELHQELTRREHAEAALKLNPDKSKDQVVRGK
jgi:hypothetical protein